MTFQLDTRIHAVNLERGVVEAALAGQFPGLRVLTPRTAQAAGQVGLRAGPEFGSTQVTEALHGERLEVLEELPDGWWWVRTAHDGYLGYSHHHEFESLSHPALTHPAPQPLTVQAPRAHVYAKPSIQASILSSVGQGAALTALDAEPVQHGDYHWWRVAFGGDEAFLHVAATTEPPRELQAFTAQYLHVPYVWGGRTAWGLDCSGLAQLYAGKDEHGRSRLPRDADQQQAATLAVDTPQAGDLAFFPGHVGVMLDERRMIHANATHMAVTIETLGEGAYGRRLQAELTGYGRLREQA